MDLIKTIHMIAAAVSISGFITRGVWMLRDSPLFQRKWVKVLPHVNDTVLLISAIMLAVRLHEYPLADNWLTAKLLALFVYIGLGMMALRYGKTRLTRVKAFILAIIVFIYIVAVAMTRNPLVFTLA